MDNKKNEAEASKNRKGKDQPMNGQSGKPAFGTKEWCDWKINLFSGCEHRCIYCFACAGAVRFKRKSPDTWKDVVVNIKKVEKGYRKRKGLGMYPTTHDITPNTVDASLVVLKKLLSAGNEMLIVTKPHFEVIVRLCDELKDYKEQFLFRFTIGSANPKTLKFWEPDAPSFRERIDSLEYAYQQGFQTSISMEPVLDLEPEKVVDKVYDMVTDDIWIGLPNLLNARLKMNGYGDDEQVMKASAELQKGQSDEWVLRLVEKYADDPKFRWKDSIRKIINKNQ